MILVAGGTGRLGSIIVRDAASSGRNVRVLTRVPSRAQHLGRGVEVLIGDVRDAEAVRRAVDGCDLVVSAVHGFTGSKGTSPTSVDRDGNAHLIDAARSLGAHMILMSGVGAAVDSPIELFRMKWAAEQRAFDQGGPTTAIRPTAFAELWIDLLHRSAKRSGRPMVFGHGVNPINFVSVTDVAALVAIAIDDRTTRGEILEIGGPANLSFTELAGMVQAADGRTAGPRHIPPLALRLVRGSVGKLKAEIGRQVGMALALDHDDFTFDSTPIHQRFPMLPTTAIGDLLDGHEPVAHLG
jgi:uncharacterized protein YbjT (DUF2867 family)